MFCRYSIIHAIGQNYLILGKINEAYLLTSDDILAIQEHTSISLPTVKLYHRIIISGTLYTSSAYTCSKIKNDSVLCSKIEGQKYFGYAKCYSSFCTNECVGCTEPCKHIVIVTPYRVLPVNIGTDEITGATAQHMHCIQPLRYVHFCSFILHHHYDQILCYRELKVYLTSQIHNKCIYM